MWGSEDKDPLVLNSVLIGEERSASSTCHFSPEEQIAGDHQFKRSHTTGLDASKNIQTVYKHPLNRVFMLSRAKT